MPLIRVAPRVDLYYEMHGAGVPIVFVHEFAGSCRSWDPQVTYFRQNFRTVVYNCRGYPPSAVPNDPRSYSQDRSVADLLRLITRLDLGEVTLIGFSMGGSIALNFSLRYPNRVSRLVIAATGSGADKSEDFNRQFETVATQLVREGVRPVADHYLTGPTRIQLKRKHPRSWRKLHTEFCRLSPQGLAQTIRQTILRRPSVYALEGDLRQLQVPTLVITGDEDIPTVEPSGFVARIVPDAQLVIFENTGHTVNLEEPIRFNESIAQFLT